MTFLGPKPLETGEPTAKVLVVDDSDELLGRSARGAGRRLSCSGDLGLEALDIAGSHEPDIVPLDVIIPPPDRFAV